MTSISKELMRSWCRFECLRAILKINLFEGSKRAILALLSHTNDIYKLFD